MAEHPSKGRSTDGASWETTLRSTVDLTTLEVCFYIYLYTTIKNKRVVASTSDGEASRSPLCVVLKKSRHPSPDPTPSPSSKFHLAQAVRTGNCFFSSPPNPAAAVVQRHLPALIRGPGQGTARWRWRRGARRPCAPRPARCVESAGEGSCRSSCCSSPARSRRRHASHCQRGCLPRLRRLFGFTPIKLYN